jgi:hypothetical protein
MQMPAKFRNKDVVGLRGFKGRNKSAQYTSKSPKPTSSKWIIKWAIH